MGGHLKPLSSELFSVDFGADISFHTMHDNDYKACCNHMKRPSTFRLKASIKKYFCTLLG